MSRIRIAALMLLFIVTSQALTVSNLNASNNGPQGSYFPAGVIDPKNNNLLFFYGMTNGLLESDTTVFHLETNTWYPGVSLSSDGSQPIPRYMQSYATMSDGRLVMFGGLSASSYLNDIHIYDPSTHTWQRLPNLSEFAASPRAKASAVVTNDNILIIYGGEDETGVLNDVKKYDLVSRQWIPVETRGILPIGRSGHSSVFWNNHVIVFGGRTQTNSILNDVIIYRVQEDSWIRPMISNSGSAPTPRFAHFVSQFDDQMCIIGGFDGQSYLNDVHCMDLSSGFWSRSFVALPEPRCCGASIYNNNTGTMYLWGGYPSSNKLTSLSDFGPRFPSFSTVPTKTGNNNHNSNTEHTRATIPKPSGLTHNSNTGIKTSVHMTFPGEIHRGDESDHSNLVWLWIVLGCVSAAMIALSVIAVVFYKRRQSVLAAHNKESAVIDAVVVDVNSTPTPIPKSA